MLTYKFPLLHHFFLSDPDSDLNILLHDHHREHVSTELNDYLPSDAYLLDGCVQPHLFARSIR
jgi:hypothetical protein